MQKSKKALVVFLCLVLAAQFVLAGGTKEEGPKMEAAAVKAGGFSGTP